MESSEEDGPAVWAQRVRHELGNAVWAASGHSELIGRSLERRRMEKLQGDLDSIHQAADRLHTYAAKLRLAAVAMEPPGGSEASLPELVQRVRYRLLSVAPEYASRLRTGRAAGVVAVAGSTLEAMLGELLANALEFTAGTVELVTEAEGSPLVLRVRDEGPAAPPEGEPPARETWARAGLSSAGRLGLGLTLVRAAAEALGGTLELGAGPDGAGSEVVLELPRARTEATAPPPAGAHRGRILVVDDMPVVCQVARRILEAEGWGVQEAPDPVAAAEAVARGAPDAILLDLHLGGASGFPLARQLRADGFVGAILGFTASEAREVQQEGGKDCVHFDAFVRKTGSLEDLGEQIERCLQETISPGRGLQLLRANLVRLAEEQDPTRRVAAAREILRDVERLEARLGHRP